MALALAKLYASAGPTLVPKIEASAENLVCTCRSPKKGARNGSKLAHGSRTSVRCHGAGNSAAGGGFECGSHELPPQPPTAASTALATVPVTTRRQNDPHHLPPRTPPAPPTPPIPATPPPPAPT